MARTTWPDVKGCWRDIDWWVARCEGMLEAAAFASARCEGMLEEHGWVAAPDVKGCWRTRRPPKPDVKGCWRLDLNNASQM